MTGQTHSVLHAIKPYMLVLAGLTVLGLIEPFVEFICGP